MGMMLACLLAAVLAQDLEGLVERLKSDDVAVREKAEVELRKRGEEIVPRILELHRSADSAEVRLRAEGLLKEFPFPAFARTKPEEPLRATLRAALLQDLKKHEGVANCWREAVRIDPARLRIEFQGGSGHGQSLDLDEIVPGKGGGLVVRRVGYQGVTPYRAEVKEEWGGVKEAVLGVPETTALVELLQAACALRPTCAIEPPRNRYWSSSGSFSMRFRIESDGSELWKAAYTGYPNSRNEPEYSHGRAIDFLLWRALRGAAWKPAELRPEDRARALRWMTANYEAEEWWVKEHYLDIARLLGDRSYLPFLEKVEAGLKGKEGVGELRRWENARQAIERISALKE
jgi:hypothetical protein